MCHDRDDKYNKWYTGLISKPISYKDEKKISCFIAIVNQEKTYHYSVRDYIYYPPELSSMRYCCLGVFRKEYFRLVTK